MTLPEAYALLEDLPYIDPHSDPPKEGSAPPPTPPPPAQRDQAVIAHQGGIVVPG